MDGTGIYQLSGRGVKSVADYDMEAANLDAAKQQKELRAMQILTGQNALDQQQQQVARTGALRQLAGTWKADTTDDQRIGSLKNAGFFDEADKLEKGLLDRKKTEAEAKVKMSEADKNRLGLFTTKLEQNHKMWETVTNPQEAHALVDATFADPEMAAVARARGQTPEQAHASIPDGKDPAAFQNFLVTRSKGMDALIKYLRPDANTVANNQTSVSTNAATNARMAAEGAANRGVQVRGQDLTDARARDLNTITKADKEASRKEEANNKAVTKFSDTIQKEGIPELETAVGLAEGEIAKYKPGTVPGVGPAKNVAPDFLMSTEGKSVRQALAQVRNIVLSARSGAAVTDQELRRLVEELGTGAGKTEEDLRRGLKQIRDRVESIKQNSAAGVSDEVLDTYTKRGGVQIKRGGGSSSFASEAEAEAAAAAGKIKKGDKITVNGQSGVWQ